MQPEPALALDLFQLARPSAVDLEALAAIQPDLIITQDLCHVCAASPGDLASALATLSRAPRVLSLTPHNLAEVWNDIRTIGEAAGRGPQAQALAAELERRVTAVEEAVTAFARPRVLCLEWLDPPFTAGHWVPEMVVRAGGRDPLGRAGEPSFRAAWETLLATRPEVVVVMPCGYTLRQTVEEFQVTPLPSGWEHLPAVQAGRVFAVDASSYFSRPGPRLAAGVEILAHLFHPELAAIGPPAGSASLVRTAAAN